MMSKDKEKEFTEYVERILSGEEAEMGEDADEDFRSAADFASKLVELRGAPSEQFKGQLKEKLMGELVKKQVEETYPGQEGNWFWNALGKLIPQSPVMRTAAATFVVILVTVGVFWRTGIFFPQAGTESQDMLAGVFAVEEAESGELVIEKSGAPVEDAEAPPPRVMLTETDEESQSMPILEMEMLPAGEIIAAYGETVAIDLNFRNMTEDTIILNNYPPSINIVGGVAMRPVLLLVAGTESKELAPGETVHYAVSWNQRDSDGAQVIPGEYTIYIGEIMVLQGIDPVIEVAVGFPDELVIIIQSP